MPSVKVHKYTTPTPSIQHHGFCKTMNDVARLHLEFYFRDHFLPYVGLARSFFMQGRLFLLARSVCFLPKILCNRD